MAGPLSSLKILDFTSLLPGPFGTMLLADMGADVIRIESPNRPDPIRFAPPQQDGVSATHAFLNRSKKSLALDLKKPEGPEVIKKLIQEYDIIIEQFRPGVMDRLGVGYEALKEINPGLIYCAITGYGQDGPYKLRAGHDLNYLSIAGITSYNGREESGPAPMSVQVADVAGGSCHAVMGILAAVVHRQQTGEGQYIDISMTDAAFTFHALNAAPALNSGYEPKLESTQLNGGHFYDCYLTSDGRAISVGGLEPQFFQRFCEAIGKPEWSGLGINFNPKVQKQLKKDIAEVIKTKSFEEWNEIFANTDSCTEPVLTFAEACEHPQIQARNMVVDVPRPGGETTKQVGSAFKFSVTQPEYKHTGTQLGADSRAILAELGYSDEQIDALQSSGVTQQA